MISSLTLRTMPEPPQRRGLKLEGPLEALGPLAAWLLGSSLSPERIDWWRPPARQEDDTGLLISLASINAHTLDEQIGCIAAKAAPLAITAQTLEPAELASLVGQSQGSETGSSDCCCGWRCAPTWRLPYSPSQP